MEPLSFDATIDVSAARLAEHGLRADAAARAVRHAVRAMPGAGWIDVEAGGDLPLSLEWCVVYPGGTWMIPDTDEWRALQERVRRVCEEALAHGAARHQ